MNVRLYLHPFHTLGIDLVVSVTGNKFIFTAVRPFSNFLISILIPDKTVSTCVVLFHVLLRYGFPSVLQSDRGGEFLNSILHRITKRLQVKHVFTTPYRPRLNGATERVHRCLNSTIGIFCEKYQNQWEDYLQPATYALNISPISGCENLDPSFLTFGRHALSPDIISLELPPKPISQDHYAHHLVSCLQDAYREFSTIKADLKRYQREFYDSNRVKNIDIVYIRKDLTGETQGATRFIRNFEGPFKVIGHYYDRSDL